MPPMSNKNKNKQGIVYSTDPEYRIDENEEQEEEETLSPEKQKLRVIIERKNRGGKDVTIVLDFRGSLKDIEDLGKKLKTHCGTGGSVKDWEILVQGDHRDKVLKYLIDKGYTQTKRGN